MLTIPIISCVEEIAVTLEAESIGRDSTIHCYWYPVVASEKATSLPSERKLAIEALTLFMRIESGVREARAEWNQDRFRRLMRLRPRAVSRLRRRWERLNPQPRISLGSLRRRYHPNLGGYLYEAIP